MDVDVTIEVEGTELGVEEELIVDMYAGLIETYLEKNADYGGSYIRSAAIKCYYDHGEVTDDLLMEYIAEQVFMRMLDKQSRAHELLLNEGMASGHVDDERAEDTLLDWANYCVMLAAQVRMYSEDEYEFASEYASVIQSELQEADDK